jgi:hypothetical protein
MEILEDEVSTSEGTPPKSSESGDLTPKKRQAKRVIKPFQIRYATENQAKPAEQRRLVVVLSNLKKIPADVVSETDIYTNIDTESKAGTSGTSSRPPLKAPSNRDLSRQTP